MLINDREYRIVIPQYDNSGNKIDPKQIEYFAKKMAEHFGGVTVIPNVLGCWKDESGKLQCEKNTLLISNDDSEKYPNWSERKAESERFINNLASEIGKKLGQACVYTSESRVEVNFVEGKYKKALPKSIRYKPDWFVRELLR